ncbi:MAG TPA: ATP-binding protein [Polyangiales bacterium]|nr:ATP-binding protein [Polyangiales bacterium]
MTRRFVISVVAALLCALAATWVAVALTLQRHERSLEARARQAALEVHQRYDDGARDLVALLQQACSRDVLVERIALELAAGGAEEGDVARVAKSLAESLHGDVWLLHERGGVVSTVGASAHWPHELPALGELQASRRPSAWDEAYIASCRRPVGSDALWLVRVEALGELRDRLAARDPLAEFADEGALALRVPSVDDREPFEAYLRVRGAPPLSELLPLAPLLVVLLLAGALLVYAFVARKPIDDSVLSELEAAAERVARGDLTTQIGRRFSGRADQTIRTFDRMTSELAEVRNKLGEAERAAAFQDIAQRIAHEIKNPLSPIQLSIETLRKAHAKRSPDFDEIFDESTRAILEEVRRMERIVREFSEFARLPKAKLGLLELGSLAVDTLALYEPDDVKVTVIHPQPVMARVDREQLAQVLVNLVQNAIDAARSAKDPRVEVHIEPGALHVDDNGPGIPAHERERVFEPYFTTKEQGTGLGLAIVKRIVHDHGGSIQVAESPLGGARFTLRLPG